MSHAGAAGNGVPTEAEAASSPFVSWSPAGVPVSHRHTFNTHKDTER